MIKLYTPSKSKPLPPAYQFCHHTLSVDYKELFNEKIRMSSNKCFTRIEQPYYCDGNYIITCEITSKEGFYKNITFRMNVIVPKGYPFNAPKIVTLTKVLHPNIHFETGEVYISMLKETEWIPVLNLNFILFALELVLIQPNIEYIPDCLQNYELVNIYQNDLYQYESLVQESYNQCLYENNSVSTEMSEEEDGQSFMKIEKQMSQMKMNENNLIKCEGIVKSLRLDFEKHEPKKQEILEKLNSSLMNIEKSNPNPRKRYREEETLITPFLKQVRISPL